MNALAVLLLSIPYTTMADTTMFSDDAAFLSQHLDTILLKQESGATIVLAPALQGRVMTSSYDAEQGPSFGWINRELIELGFRSEEEVKGTLEEKVYVFGGEERFWLGPEGGQFSYFFQPGAEFEFTNWSAPGVIDTEAFSVVDRSESHATFSHDSELTNQSGNVFKMAIQRRVDLLTRGEIAKRLMIPLPEEVKAVAYQTNNQITNTGENSWTEQTGLPSIWLLGMYTPSATTTVVIPIAEAEALKVNDEYFGEIPEDYLKTTEHHVFMKGDGTRRGKIGILPERSLEIAASYDSGGQVLNIVTYTPQPAPNGYVNSMWEIQEEPFAGDVINAYNDGSPEPGTPPMGPFYELETSSPAAALAPNETMTHKQQTYHLHGPEEILNKFSLQLLNISLKEIKEAF